MSPIADAGQPPDLVDRISGALRAAMTKPEMVESFARYGLIVRDSSPEESGAFLRTQGDAFAKAVRLAKIPIEG